ncbi:hypothetical protein ACTQZK_06345 [Paraeggerthella sp. LCP19S3_G8]|uniref:hypothetical protein n=1 Tax=Paraeggerthella sp. LCP19S3_G8 TaxID=3440248 RepID=UPI002A84CE8B|nr:hypothetical protein [Paraeggerthella sp.]
MLKSRRPLPTYPDGMVAIYREKDRKTDFGAKRNPRSLDHMDHVVTLAYALKSCREQDFTFAEQQGFALSMKVRTPAFADVDSACKAVIGSSLFDLSHVDKAKREMYLYLSSAGELEAGA